MRALCDVPYVFQAHPVFLLRLLPFLRTLFWTGVIPNTTTTFPTLSYPHLNPSLRLDDYFLKECCHWTLSPLMSLSRHSEHPLSGRLQDTLHPKAPPPCEPLLLGSHTLMTDPFIFCMGRETELWGKKKSLAPGSHGTHLYNSSETPAH